MLREMSPFSSSNSLTLKKQNPVHQFTFIYKLSVSQSQLRHRFKQTSTVYDVDPGRIFKLCLAYSYTVNVHIRDLRAILCGPVLYIKKPKFKLYLRIRLFTLMNSCNCIHFLCTNILNYLCVSHRLVSSSI